MSKKHKTPVHNIDVTGIKTPRHKEQPDSYFGESPVWKIALADRTHERWKISEDKFDEDFIKKLIDFEGMTWGQIMQSSGGRRKGTNNHFISVDSFFKEAQQRLSELKLDEHQELFSLRLKGRERLLGLLRDGVFFMIWKDDDHQVCPCPKKHT